VRKSRLVFRAIKGKIIYRGIRARAERRSYEASGNRENKKKGFFGRHRPRKRRAKESSCTSKKTLVEKFAKFSERGKSIGRGELRRSFGWERDHGLCHGSGEKRKKKEAGQTDSCVRVGCSGKETVWGGSWEAETENAEKKGLARGGW